MRLPRLRHREVALGRRLDAQGREQRAQLSKFARVVGGDDDPVHVPSAVRCNVISFEIPAVARSISFDSCSRVKGAPSAVPCTSTKWPAPVITTFMSVSQLESS